MTDEAQMFKTGGPKMAVGMKSLDAAIGTLLSW